MSIHLTDRKREIVKRILTLLFAAGLFSFGTVSTASAASWDIDGSHAFALFKVMHLGIAPSYGQFVKVGGTVDFDAANPAAAKIKIELDATSIFSGNKKRDDHLKGPDFFDVKQFPKATFESTAWKKTGDNTFDVTGNMTIKGKSQQITVPVTLTGAGKDPWGNDRAGFETTFKIDRMAYGVNYMPDGLGKEVTIMISIEAIKKK